MTVVAEGRRAVVQRNDGHPSDYLWVIVNDRRFFLGVRTAGMTRGDVKRMALAWLREHPNA